MGPFAGSLGGTTTTKTRMGLNFSFECLLWKGASPGFSDSKHLTQPRKPGMDQKNSQWLRNTLHNPESPISLLRRPIGRNNAKITDRGQAFCNMQVHLLHPSPHGWEVSGDMQHPFLAFHCRRFTSFCKTHPSLLLSCCHGCSTTQKHGISGAGPPFQHQ